MIAAVTKPTFAFVNIQNTDKDKNFWEMINDMPSSGERFPADWFDQSVGGQQHDVLNN